MNNQNQPNSNNPHPGPIIKFETSIPSLHSKFYFHDKVISSSGFSNHYIVEDVQSAQESGDEQESQFFYYLKQSIYTSKAEYLHALSFYQKLYKYGKSKFCKSDMIKLHFLFYNENEQKKTYELISVFDFGEPDRIDMDVIETQHINKFLKNMCLLFSEIKKFDNLYHSNIEIPNIVLVNRELKISAFKPRYIMNQNYNSWKIELIRKHGHFRLDLFLIGLLWLKFLRIPSVDEIETKSRNLDEMITKSKQLIDSLEIESKNEIIYKLVDIENYPNMTVEDVLISFGENYVLENRKKTTGKNDDDEKNKFPLEYNTYEQFELHPSTSRESNLFLKPYRESLPDLHVDKRSFSREKDNQEGLIIEREFTLRHEGSVKDFEEANNNLIDVKDGKNPKFIDESEKTSKFLDKMNNRVFSEKTFSVDQVNIEDVKYLRKLKSDQKFFIFNNSSNELEFDVQKKYDLEDKKSVELAIENEKQVLFKKKQTLSKEDEKFVQIEKDLIKVKNEQGEKLDNDKKDEELLKSGQKSSKKTDLIVNEKTNKEKPDTIQRDLLKKEKEKELKLKIDKKLAENLEKKKKEKIETAKKGKEKEVLKYSRDFDSKKGIDSTPSPNKELPVPSPIAKSTTIKSEKSTLEELKNRLEKQNGPISKIVDNKTKSELIKPDYNNQFEPKTSFDKNEILKDEKKEAEIRIKSFNPEENVHLKHEVFDSQKKHTFGSQDQQEINEIVLPVFPKSDELVNVFGYSNTNDVQFSSKETIGFNSDVQSANVSQNSFIKNEVLETQFRQSVSIIKTLFLEENFEECLEILKQFSAFQNQNKNIEFLKLKSLIYFKMKKFDLAKEELFSALKILQMDDSLENPRDNLRSILTNIAIIEYQKKEFEEVVEILQNKIFEDEDDLTKDHFLLIADCYFEMEEFTPSFFNYDKTLQVLMINDLHPSDLPLFKQIASKIVICLSKMNENEVILKFIASSVEILTKYKPVLSKSSDQKVRFVEDFVYSTLKLIVSMKNEDQIEDLLNFYHDEKIVSITRNFEDEELCFFVDCSKYILLTHKNKNTMKLIKMTMYFANLIKDELKKDEIKFFMLYKKSSIYIELKNYQKAITSLEKGLELSTNEIQSVESNVHKMFFNIGVCNWHLGNIDEASFYFDKVLIDDYLDEKMEVKVLKMLSKIYFKLEIYGRCKIILDDLINIEPKSASVLKYMIMFYICFEKLKVGKIDDQFYELLEKTVKMFSECELSDLVYGILLKNAFLEQRFDKAEKFLNYLGSKKVLKNDVQCEMVIKLNNIQIKVIKKLYFEANEQLKNLSLNTKSHDQVFDEKLRSFILNLQVVLLNKFDLTPETIAEKNAKIIELMSIKESQGCFDPVYNLLKEQNNFLNSISFASEARNLNFTEDKSEQSEYFSDNKKQVDNLAKSHYTAPKSTQKESDGSDFKKDMYQQIIQKEYIEPISAQSIDKAEESMTNKKLKRVKSVEIIQKSNVKKSKCSCFEFNRKNPELVKIIKEILTSLKNGKIDYEVFRKTIFDLKGKLEIKKLKFLKFSYIKKIFKLFQRRFNNEGMETIELYLEFEVILSNKDICMHDVKKILILFDITSEIKGSLFDQFIIFLDFHHKNLLRSALNQQIIPSFRKKQELFISEIYRKVFNSQNNLWKNFALMHYLDIEKSNTINPAKLINLVRPRFQFVGFQSNYAICVKYLNPNELSDIYLSGIIRSSIEKYLKDETFNEEQIMMNLLNNIRETIEHFAISKISSKFFIYEYFACLLVLNNFDSKKMIEIIFEALLFLEKKMNIRSLYHFSIICSFFGNLLFSFKHFDFCLKAKHISYICLKKITDIELAFPSFIGSIEPTALMYSILSFNAMANVELEKIDKAKGMIGKMKQILFETASNEYEKRLLFAFFEVCYGSSDVSKSILNELQSKKLNLSENNKSKEMYEVIISKIVGFIQREQLKKEKNEQNKE